MSYQSQISANANAIVLAASQRMVAICAQASLNILNGIESKKQLKHANKIVKLLQAYSHPNDLLAAEADSILYALRELSDAYTFPTVGPIVGQSLIVIAPGVTPTLPLGIMVEIGNYDASSNSFPSSGGTGAAGAVLKGNWWNISVAGTLGGESVSPGASILAMIDNPGQTLANWRIIP